MKTLKIKLKKSLGSWEILKKIKLKIKITKDESQKYYYLIK